MAVIVCHSPKGGSGNTFLTAQIAIGLADSGRNVTVLSLSKMDTLPLHFGLTPGQVLPMLTARPEEAVVALGIDLRNHPRGLDDDDLLPMLRDAGFFIPSTDNILILDVPAHAPLLTSDLLAASHLHICPLEPTPDCTALLPQLFEARDRLPGQTLFIVNRLDETRRLARHSTAFLRELIGAQLIGKVRQDEAVSEALASLQLLRRYAPASAVLADMRAIVDIIAQHIVENEHLAISVPSAVPLPWTGKRASQAL